MTVPIIPVEYKAINWSSAQHFELNHVGLHLDYLSSYLFASTENSEPFNTAGNSWIYVLTPFAVLGRNNSVISWAAWIHNSNADFFLSLSPFNRFVSGGKAAGIKDKSSVFVNSFFLVWAANISVIDLVWEAEFSNSLFILFSRFSVADEGQHLTPRRYPPASILYVGLNVCFSVSSCTPPSSSSPKPSHVIISTSIPLLLQVFFVGAGLIRARLVSYRVIWAKSWIGLFRIHPKNFPLLVASLEITFFPDFLSG